MTTRTHRRIPIPKIRVFAILAFFQNGLMVKLGGEIQGNFLALEWLMGEVLKKV